MNAHGELNLGSFVFSVDLIRQCRNRVAKYFVEWRVPGLTEICTNQRPKVPRKVVTMSYGEKNVLFRCDHIYFPKGKCDCKETGLQNKKRVLGVSELKYVSNQLNIS